MRIELLLLSVFRNSVQMFELFLKTVFYHSVVMNTLLPIILWQFHYVYGPSVYIQRPLWRFPFFSFVISYTKNKRTQIKHTWSIILLLYTIWVSVAFRVSLLGHVLRLHRQLKSQFYVGTTVFLTAYTRIHNVVIKTAHLFTYIIIL